MTRNSDNQAGGYPEGMDHEIQPVSGEPETGGVTDEAIDRVMAVLNYWFDGLRRIDRKSDMVRQLAALSPLDQSRQGEAVAWRLLNYDGDEVVGQTFDKKVAHDWRDRALVKIQPLYAAPPPAVAGEVTAATLLQWIAANPHSASWLATRNDIVEIVGRLAALNPTQQEPGS